jgi:hypothetical protein
LKNLCDANIIQDAEKTLGGETMIKQVSHLNKANRTAYKVPRSLYSQKKKKLCDANIIQDAEKTLGGETVIQQVRETGLQMKTRGIIATQISPLMPTGK